MLKAITVTLICVTAALFITGCGDGPTTPSKTCFVANEARGVLYTPNTYGNPPPLCDGWAPAPSKP